MFTFAAMQFVASPILGNLSDRFGRRPVLLLSLFAMAFLMAAIASAISSLQHDIEDFDGIRFKAYVDYTLAFALVCFSVL